LIKTIVANNDKQRFILSEDGNHIRANQGHSVKVDLGLEAVSPPSLLYHGTANRFLDIILQEGLKKMSRQHVHLSVDLETASKVGQRHGKLVILKVDTLAMSAANYDFYRSDNGVWLTGHVPAEFLALA